MNTITWHRIEDEAAPRGRPVLTWDGKDQAVVEWDERLQDFALSPDEIFVADPADYFGGHRIEWHFTHWAELPEPPA